MWGGVGLGWMGVGVGVGVGVGQRGGGRGFGCLCLLWSKKWNDETDPGWQGGVWGGGGGQGFGWERGGGLVSFINSQGWRKAGRWSSIR